MRPKIGSDIDWQRLTRSARQAVDRAVRETAMEGARRAKINIERQGLIDFGFLLNSVYVVSVGQDGTAAAEAAAGARNPGARFGTPPTDRAEPGVAIVAVGAEYGLLLEMGHLAVRNTTRMSTRKSGATAQRISDRRFGTAVPARPFLRPALDSLERDLQRSLEAAIETI